MQEKESLPETKEEIIDLIIQKKNKLKRYRAKINKLDKEVRILKKN